MFSKILIANRGEIACRIAATARQMGIRTVAVYSDADAQSKHVASCDQAVPIGGHTPKESYLQWQRIIDAAIATGAQAIHPGYGFLSENHSFAEACGERGIVFIGPSAHSIQAMGLKAESKRLMAQAGVPLVPGYHGSDQSPDLLIAKAGEIGFPVIIKASAGGGGRGMRVVVSAEDFAPALLSCQREAANSFDNDAVLIEKYVQQPRHIEIQVFADNHGQCVYLFERDCSVQRRHQKLIEESPAPGLTEDMRQQMGQAAVAAAQAVGYVGAGTVEFIVEQPNGHDDPENMRFYFMEMNTRLQVEHPVTEAVTGIDLVQWQLRIAAGEPLPLRQDQLRINGHAIEARICAENPNNQFMPVTGLVSTYNKPPHSAFTVAPFDGPMAGVRFDDGVRAGDTITPFYDSMIAKVIVHGATRAQALARLGAALADTHIVGLTTNVQFLRDIIRTDSFSKARLDTALISREADALFDQDHIGVNQAVAAAVAHTLRREKATETHDAFSVRDGWRAFGQTQRRLDFEYRQKTLSATLTYGKDGELTLQVGDQIGPLRYVCLTDNAFTVQWCHPPLLFSIYAIDQCYTLFGAQGITQITAVDPLSQASQAHDDVGNLQAPMPGSMVSFMVQVGDTVTKGQPLAVIEAMKMEHTISAPNDGVVQALLFAVGDQVQEGVPLLKLTVAKV